MVPLPGVFRPPSDAVMLAEKIREQRLPLGACVLDLCTGSGYLAIVAAQQGATRVVATDISRRAVIATKLNALLNGVDIDPHHGDLFEPVGHERFHLIVRPRARMLKARGLLGEDQLEEIVVVRAEAK